MKSILKAAAASALFMAIGTISANAACNGDSSTETVLGAGSGALVGGLASHSIAGAAIGGVAGGLIGNAIGQSNNREDCRRDAYNPQDQYTYNQGDRAYYPDTTYPSANRAYYYPDSNGGYRDNSTDYYANDNGFRYYDGE